MFIEPEPSDPPGWVDGAPTSALGQSCALCGARTVAWIHPLTRQLVTYQEYGKGHTLPALWALCERCESLSAAGDDDAVVEVMRTSAWSHVEDEDVTECIRQPLAVFRRADRGARRVRREASAVTEATRHGFVPLRDLTGIGGYLGPLWPEAHRVWLDELGPVLGDDSPGEPIDRWLVRSPWPSIAASEAIGALWRWVEQDRERLEHDAEEALIREFFARTEPEVLALTDPDS